MGLFRKEPDPFAAGRYADIVKSVRRRERKHMRHWWQWALLLTFLFVAGIAGYGTYRYYDLQNDIQGDVATDERTNELDPFNALLVGSDNRGTLTPEERLDLGAGEVGGNRADTLILAHIDPREQSVVMVQFPRDLYVPIYGRGSDKINAALEDGPDILIKTVKQLTGLKIHQYVQVNIAGFRDIVDAIGGVDICLTEPIPFDPQTGLEVTEEELGLVHFDGDRALRFVRSRNFETGDFERILNQQKFVSAAVDKITSRETLFHPTRILKLADVAGENLRTDAATTIGGLVDLAQRLQDFNPERYEAYVAPNFGVGSIDGLSVVLPNETAMEVMFDAIAENESPAEADGVPDIDPSTVRVGVYNGTGETGAASFAAADLEEATDLGDEGPVNVIEVGDAKKTNYKETVIVHEPEAEKLAEVVAAAVPGARLEEGRTRKGIDVAVVVGRKFRTEQLVELLPLPLPKPGEVPDICRR